MKHTILLALGLALLLPVQGAKPNAGGQTKPKRTPAQVFKKKDTDRDGFLSKAEFTAKAKDAAKAETAFNKRDKNSDGKLTLAEFAGKRGRNHQADQQGKGHRKAKAKAARQGKGRKKGQGGKQHN